MNGCDIAWMLVATALVLVMTPALGFFYAGLVRSKNTLNTLMMSVASLGFVGLAWAIGGYSIAFAPGTSILGGTAFAFLRGVGLEAHGTIPHLLFMAFQATFAIITAALVSGAIVERMRFGAYLVFITVWSLVVYAPIAHWVWGGGWLAGLGALDFAGGTVVHISAGAAALVAAIVLGPRKDYARQALVPHSVPFTLLGTGILWFGWFGFNAGSALEANNSAALAFMNTFLATACAVLSWSFLEWMFKGKPSMLGATSGAVAGLVAITPAAGNVGIPGAFVIGAAAGAVCLWGVSGLKKMLKADDSLDVFGVHAIGGIAGALLTGVFNSPALGGPSFPVDWFTGKLVTEADYSIMSQFIIQAKAVGVSLVWSGVVAFLSYKIADLLVGMRVPEEEERQGLDTTAHGETAYN